MRSVVRVRGAILLVLAAGLACGELEPAAEVAPEFSFPDLDGEIVSLADLRGKAVVIDFWATWCAPCVFQPGELNEVWRRHGDSGRLAILGLEVGEASPEEIRAWGEENDAVAGYPLLVGVPESLARRYGVLGFPATVIVAPDGTVDSVGFGVKTAAEIEAAIAHWLP